MVNFTLCSYVDASGRLIEDQDITVSHQPFGDNNFLLVSSGKVYHQLIHVGSLCLQGIHIFLGDSSLFLLIDESAAHELVHGSHRGVLRHALSYDDTVTFPVLRKITDTIFYRIHGILDIHFFSVYVDLSALLGVCSEKSSGRLGTSCAHQAGETEDLAFVKLEAYILYHFSCVEVFHLEYYRSVLRNVALGLRILVNDTANHHVDDVVLGTFLGDEGAYIAAVTHDGHAVRDDLDLIHTMRDINDSHALITKVTDDFKQLFDLGLSQRC